ncbi:hypothetical protein B0H13DRAFT_2534706 [Mycena leptocephala]|nr:hypothetical protein B0H13DRAFT_2534706 [Mycena leptocephala]
MREFAQELVDLVIDNVAATTNTRDIGTCGSVCRRWLPRSRMHLFYRITLSNTEPAAIQSFLDLIDASSPHIISFVRTLHIRLVPGWVAESHMARLQSFPVLTELCIHGLDSFRRVEEFAQFERLLHTHVPRFGAACLSLTRFHLALPGDMFLDVLVNLISGLPFLTHLRLSSTYHDVGIVGRAMLSPTDPSGPQTDAFPPNLHTLEISLWRGIGLLFKWLLSQRKPPIFTSLTLAGTTDGEPIEPIEPIDTYLSRFGPQIESLSLAYRVAGLNRTIAFEACALASTLGL